MEPLVFLRSMAEGGAILGISIALFLVGKLINDWTTPYKLDVVLAERDNAALGVSLSGYYLGLAIALSGVVWGDSKGLANDIMELLKYGAAAIILLNISRVINDRLILYKIDNRKEIIEDHNAGVGAAQLGSYVASGLIIFGAVAGEGGGLIDTLIFYLLGQAGLIVFCFIYQWITPYNLFKQLEEDNVACGISFCGGLIALGVILKGALTGKAVSWQVDLAGFGAYAAAGFILLPIIRLIIDKLFFPRSNLNKELAEDRNIAAAFVEAGVLIASASLITANI